MKDYAMQKTSRTDWDRVDAMTDEQIDTSDIPPLDDAFFARAKRRLPDNTVQITMEVDADVLAWFKAQSKMYPQLMSAALRLYAEVHQAHQ